MYMWRAVDAEAEVLDILLRPRRDRKAALKLMRKLLKKQGVVPDAVVTDRLASYQAALGELGLWRRQVTGGRSNNRAEISHRHDSGNDECGVSSRPDRLSASCSSMPPSTIPSTSIAT